MSGTNRFQNQSRLLTEDARGQWTVTIVGGGAIGSFVALALTKMGVSVEIWDEDRIENHNFANQMMETAQLGMNKAEAVRDTCYRFSGERVTAIPLFMDDEAAGELSSTILVLAVDSMATRKMIAKRALDRRGITIIDARMGGQNYRVITTSFLAEYEKTLYTDEQAAPDLCGQKSIIYTVLGCASEVCNSVRRIMMGEPTTFEVFKDYNVPGKAVVHEEVI